MTAVAGGKVQAADITGLAALTTGMPLVRLVASSTQNLTNNTATAITFTGSEDIDTHNYHNPSTNPSRITPLIAGYYIAKGTVYFSSQTTYTGLEAGIGKNAAIQAPAGRRVPPLVAGAQSAEAQAMLLMNGTSDYIELYAIQTNSGSSTFATNQSARYSCVLEVWFLRPQ
jgi:hypothetical protein